VNIVDSAYIRNMTDLEKIAEKSRRTWKTFFLMCRPMFSFIVITFKVEYVQAS